MREKSGVESVMVAAQERRRAQKVSSVMKWYFKSEKERF
jgi:hypothetical protein